jgi:hypothetical protein
LHGIGNLHALDIEDDRLQGRLVTEGDAALAGQHKAAVHLDSQPTLSQIGQQRVDILGVFGVVEQDRRQLRLVDVETGVDHRVDKARFGALHKGCLAVDLLD